MFSKYVTCVIRTYFNNYTSNYYSLMSVNMARYIHVHINGLTVTNVKDNNTVVAVTISNIRCIPTRLVYILCY